MTFRGNLGFSLYAVCGVPCGFLCLCPAPRAPLPPKQLTGATGVLSALGWREEGECFHHKQGRSGITKFIEDSTVLQVEERLPGLLRERVALLSHSLEKKTEVAFCPAGQILV